MPTPTSDEIRQRAMEIYRAETVTGELSTNQPVEDKELREGGYFQRAKMELMSGSGSEETGAPPKKELIEQYRKDREGLKAMREAIYGPPKARKPKAPEPAPMTVGEPPKSKDISFGLNVKDVGAADVGVKDMSKAAYSVGVASRDYRTVPFEKFPPPAKIETAPFYKFPPPATQTVATQTQATTVTEPMKETPAASSLKKLLGTAKEYGKVSLGYGKTAAEKASPYATAFGRAGSRGFSDIAAKASSGLSAKELEDYKRLRIKFQHGIPRTKDSGLSSAESERYRFLNSTLRAAPEKLTPDMKEELETLRERSRKNVSRLDEQLQKEYDYYLYLRGKRLQAANRGTRFAGALANLTSTQREGDLFQKELALRQRNSRYLESLVEQLEQENKLLKQGRMNA